MEEALKELNDPLLAKIKDNYEDGPSSFSLWFEGLKIVSFDGASAVLVTPSDLKTRVLSSRYKKLIEESLAEVTGFFVPVEIFTDKAQPAPKTVVYEPSQVELSYEPEEPALPRFNSSFASGDSLTNDRSPVAQKTVSLYTFDNFIEGETNRFAKAACMGVSLEPGFSYNPLFIYGNSGLGKTHLLYATIKALEENHPGIRIVYKRCETFLNELVVAIKQSATDVFKERYRNCDVLLIDDIQFIAGKEGCQEEFFHTFSSLYEADKQIILTSDRPPNEINPLADRLRSRFESGIIADIKIPGFELRSAITKKKADALGLKISDDLIYYIAQRLRVNIRQIEGVLKKLNMLCGLTGASITKEAVDEAIFSVDPTNMPNDIIIERTLDAVSKRYGVPVEDIKSKKRTDSIAKARHIAIYLIKEVIDEISLREIGQIFGGRDHSTIHSSINKVISDMRTVNGVEDDVKRLIKEIKGLTV